MCVLSNFATHMGLIGISKTPVQRPEYSAVAYQKLAGIEESYDLGVLIGANPNLREKKSLQLPLAKAAQIGERRNKLLHDAAYISKRKIVAFFEFVCRKLEKSAEPKSLELNADCLLYAA